MQIRFLKGLCLIVLILITAGCQSIGGRSVQIPVANGDYQLQYGWPKEPVQLWQNVEWQNEQQQRTFMVSALFKHDRLLLIALSPFGHELFRSELSRAGGITFKGSEAFNDARMALQVWADLQMALWPLASVNANLTGGSLQATQTGRELWSNGQLQWSLSSENKSQQRVIQNKTMGYELTITTLEYERLETDDNHIK